MIWRRRYRQSETPEPSSEPLFVGSDIDEKSGDMLQCFQGIHIVGFSSWDDFYQLFIGFRLADQFKQLQLTDLGYLAGEEVLKLGFEGSIRDRETEYLPQLAIAELGFSLHRIILFLFTKEHFEGNA